MGRRRDAPPTASTEKAPDRELRFRSASTDILLSWLADQISLGTGLSRAVYSALARYPDGDRVADWDGIPREPFCDRVIPEAWPALVKFREGLIPQPVGARARVDH